MPLPNPFPFPKYKIASDAIGGGAGPSVGPNASGPSPGVPNYSSPGGYGAGTPSAGPAPTNNQYNNGQPTKPAPVQGGGGGAVNDDLPAHAAGPYDQRIDPQTGQPYHMQIGQSAADIQPDFYKNYLGMSADLSRPIERVGTPEGVTMGAYRIGGLDSLLGGYGAQFNTLQQQQQLAQARGNKLGGNADQSRAMAIQALTAQGPSAAESQLFAGQEAAQANALAMARSGRGFSSGGQMRQAQFAGQDAMAQASQQAATLRAQEEAQRRQQLLSLGGQDIGALGQEYQRGLSAGGQGLQALGGQGVLASAQQQAFADWAKTNAGLSLDAAKTNANFANYEQPAPPDNTWQDVATATGAGAGVAAGIASLAAAFSDKRSKTRIRQLEDENRELSGAFGGLPPSKSAGSAAAALGAVPANSYRYRPQFQGAPGGAPGNQVGPMAQDLERTLPSTVMTGQDGIKRVDPGRLALANASATGEIARRLAALEDTKGEAKRTQDLGQLPPLEVSIPQNLGTLPPMSVTVPRRRELLSLGGA